MKYNNPIALKRTTIVITDLSTHIRSINEKNKWNLFYEKHWEEENILPAKLALLHSEISEGLEAYRADNKPEFFKEMADTFIRILDIMGGFDVNFAQVILDKMAYNATRSERHGGKKL